MIKEYSITSKLANGETTEFVYNNYINALKDFNLFVRSVRPDSCTLWEEDRDGIRSIKEYRKPSGARRNQGQKRVFNLLNLFEAESPTPIYRGSSQNKKKKTKRSAEKLGIEASIQLVEFV